MEKSKIDSWEARFIAWYDSQGRLTDGSHDLGHFQRVWRVARDINRREGGAADELVLLASAYFHDLVALPKDHPERGGASRMSADRAVELLKERWDDFPDERLSGVWHAIHAHSYSARVEPVTAEAKILQDADRMEAVGAIGLARVFYTAGQLNGRLFDVDDPLAEEREPDDRRYALDHFQLKLLRLPAMMNTATGRRMAEERAEYLREFLLRICREIRGS
jgi:uncharacterized protein